MTEEAAARDPFARRMAWAAFAAGLACMTGLDDVLRAHAGPEAATLTAAFALVVARL